MTEHPYANLPDRAFWRNAVAAEAAQPSPDWCRPKWPIRKSDPIATAGSCFAQHLGRRLRKEGYSIMDGEPAPSFLPPAQHETHGYSLYSARYGNIYTARQMRQLAEEAFGRRPVTNEVWEQGGRFFDPLRPGIDPEGHGSAEAVTLHRQHHLRHVAQLLRDCRLLVFTLGLTECWENAETGLVYPVCPGTVAGRFDPALHRFRNLTFNEVLDDMLALRDLLAEERGGTAPRILLTVSPVPLTATATEDHVMLATVYSKAVLRAVAGELAARFPDVDYFPSFEIVTNPWLGHRHYGTNLRSVTEKAVETVMRTFLGVHGGAGPGKPSGEHAAPPAAAPPPIAEEEAMLVKCDEELLERFGRRP